MSSNPIVEQTRYEVIVQEDPTTGDLLLPIPQVLLDELNWKEGMDVKFEIAEDGKIYIKRIDE